MEITARLTAKGLVQGVGYRYYVLVQGRRLGLSGYVRNLPNGDVEVVAEGERGRIEDLISACKAGPRAAHVTDLSIEWSKYESRYQGFEVR